MKSFSMIQVWNFRQSITLVMLFFQFLKNLALNIQNCIRSNLFFGQYVKKIEAQPTCNIIHKKGYSWCGGTCRWGTSEKLRALKAHTKDGIDYVGIAADETHRFEKEKRPNRVLPLRDWGITEADALQYCYTKGFVWHEDGVRLYELLDRVSCWCCGNKNLKELKNMYLYLPWYWKKLKELQLNTDRPYRRNSGETIFDLEERFKREMQQK